jgi:hypothetical protein
VGAILFLGLLHLLVAAGGQQVKTMVIAEDLVVVQTIKVVPLVEPELQTKVMLEVMAADIPEPHTQQVEAAEQVVSEEMEILEQGHPETAGQEFHQALLDHLLPEVVVEVGQSINQGLLALEGRVAAVLVVLLVLPQLLVQPILVVVGAVVSKVLGLGLVAQVLSSSVTLAHNEELVAQ